MWAGTGSAVLHRYLRVPVTSGVLEKMQRRICKSDLCVVRVLCWFPLRVRNGTGRQRLPLGKC